MGDLEGVGRIYRPEMGTHVGRSPQVDKADKDKHRREKEDERPEEEPKDTIELHESSGESPTQKPQVRRVFKPHKGLDISA